MPKKKTQHKIGGSFIYLFYVKKDYLVMIYKEISHLYAYQGNATKSWWSLIYLFYEEKYYLFMSCK